MSEKSSEAIIGDMTKLEVSSLPSVQKPTVAPISLLDLPDELLDEIGGLLLNGTISPSNEAYMRHCEVRGEEGEQRARGLTDFVSFASSCKGIRATVFGRYMLKSLVVWMNEKKLIAVEGLSEPLRRCVK